MWGTCPARMSPWLISAPQGVRTTRAASWSVRRARLPRNRSPASRRASRTWALLRVVSGGYAVTRSHWALPMFAERVTQTLAMWRAISRKDRISRPSGRNSKLGSGMASTLRTTVFQMSRKGGSRVSLSPMGAPPARAFVSDGLLEDLVGNIEVGVHPLDVVVVLQSVHEAQHLLGLLPGQGDGGLGDHGDLGGDDGVAGLLERLPDGCEVFRGRD